jgi:hypothetical protein
MCVNEGRKETEGVREEDAEEEEEEKCNRIEENFMQIFGDET